MFTTNTLPDSSADLCRSLLKEMGEDPQREGLQKTPERYKKAIAELTSGYGMTAEDAVGEGIFNSESPGVIMVRDIEFYSLCEHHLLPFMGKVSVAYFPNDKILGLSKLARVVDVFAKRLQVQERLTRQVGDSIQQLVGARYVKVVVEASHMCIAMRGVKKHDSLTRTEYSCCSDELNAEERSSLVNL